MPLSTMSRQALPGGLPTQLAIRRQLWHSRPRSGIETIRPTSLAAAWLTAVAFLAPGRALANADCGPRLFPVTLTLDDPGVGDEGAISTVSYQHLANATPTPGDDTTASFSLNKRLTEDFMLGVGGGTNFDKLPPQLGKNQTGWQELQLLAKWQDCLYPSHEFMISLGVIRELGGTGSVNAGADRYGSTGAGDLCRQGVR